jgi:hypothetical protein
VIGENSNTVGIKRDTGMSGMPGIEEYPENEKSILKTTGDGHNSFDKKERKK